MRRIVHACAAAIVMVVLVAPGMASVASAETPGVTASSDYIVWDGTTTSLNWDGSTSVVVQSPVSSPFVSVPGDEVTHTATVKNGGPTDAQVTVDILNVTSTNQSATAHSSLEDNVQLFWDINGDAGAMVWREASLASDNRHVSYSTTFPIGQGGSFPLKVGFRFPTSATGGQNGGQPSSVLSFDVRVTMTEATSSGDGGTGGTSPGTGENGGTSSETGGSGGTQSGTGGTGGTQSGTGSTQGNPSAAGAKHGTLSVSVATGGLTMGGVTIPWWVLGIATVMVVAGIVFIVDVVIVRRRRPRFGWR
ncbi:MAG: hypothetical protein FWF25_00470 [Propionibacteriaceae bacterium]|nr:hypothetical protein [Propionibacteriaceae bacterium]